MRRTATIDAKGNQFDRIQWKKIGKEDGPVLIIFAGLHGNEPAGVRAIDRISEDFNNSGFPLKGAVYAITGNIKALKLGIRYLDKDLNRIWENEYIENESGGGEQPVSVAEEEELNSIKTNITSIIERHKPETDDFIFVDLHTTSSNSCAFIPFNDTLYNRSLAKKFPVPLILSIEEYIEGTLLSYINNLGYRAIGFEAGAHSDEESVKRSRAFVWLVMHHCNMISLPKGKIKEFENLLKSDMDVPGTYYEIIGYHYVEDPETFKMISGFENFDEIRKKQPLAHEDGSLIEATKAGRIFMPLYQEKGHEGFYIIRKISPVWIYLSAYLRKSFLHSLLRFLPGVKPVENGSFEVELRTAKLLVRQVFHLLGYRIKRKDKDTLLCYRR